MLYIYMILRRIAILFYMHVVAMGICQLPGDILTLLKQTKVRMHVSAKVGKERRIIKIFHYVQNNK